mmetsp:Transcript_24674/g.37721  ORF Transcript_24674/g.37721 Transcript_24674/m.37721 type:complete len:218 (-) Transcript_24674:2113-2766(-)
MIISTPFSAAATPVTAAVKDPLEPIVSSPPSPSLSSVNGTPFASCGRLETLSLMRFRYEDLWAIGKILSSTLDRYSSSTFVMSGMDGREPAPAIFAPFNAAGSRTALSKLPFAVMCSLHLESVITAVTPLPVPICPILITALLIARSHAFLHSRKIFCALNSLGSSAANRYSSPFPLVAMHCTMKKDSFFWRESKFATDACSTSITMRFKCCTISRK